LIQNGDFELNSGSTASDWNIAYAGAGTRPPRTGGLGRRGFAGFTPQPQVSIPFSDRLGSGWQRPLLFYLRLVSGVPAGRISNAKFEI